MRSEVVLILLAALLTAPPGAHGVMASTAGVGATFGNTVLVVDPDGRSRKIWLQPDGTWTGLSRRGLDLAGNWKTQGDKVCLNQSKPRLFGSLCQTFPTELNVEIEAKDPAGKSVRLRMVRGRFEGK